MISQICGILKNILLVIASVIFWGTKISPIQIIGYSVALIGMMFYRLAWQDIKYEATSLVASYRKLFKSRIYGSGQLSAYYRRAVVAIIILLLVLTISYVWVQNRRIAARS